jgi:hypothetical protein
MWTDWRVYIITKNWRKPVYSALLISIFLPSIGVFLGGHLTFPYFYKWVGRSGATHLPKS